MEALASYGDAVAVERQAEHLDMYRATLQSAASAARLGRKQVEEPVPALSRDSGLKTLLHTGGHAQLERVAELGDAPRRIGERFERVEFERERHVRAAATVHSDQ